MEIRFGLKTVARNKKEMDSVLADILSRNDVDDWEYSLDGWEEDCVCIEPYGGIWKVYFVERGQKQMCSVFGTKEEAAKDLLYRLGRDSEQRERMLKAFREEWNPSKHIIVRENNPFKAAKVAAQNHKNGGMITIPIPIVETRPAFAMRKVSASIRKKKQDTVGTAATVSRPGIIGGRINGVAFAGGLKKVKGLPVSPTGRRSTKGKLGAKDAARKRTYAKMGIRRKGF